MTKHPIVDIKFYQILIDLSSKKLINKIVFHSPTKKSEVLKIHLKTENERVIAVFKHDKKDITKNYELERLPEIVNDLIDEMNFKKVKIFGKGFEQELLFNNKWEGKLLKPKQITDEKNQKENTPKEIINIEKKYYQDLDLTFIEKGSIKIKPKKLKKIVQIKEFLKYFELEIEKIGEFNNIVDFGCGKGYLTFGLYNYLENKKIPNFITGLDIKENVINDINKIASKNKLLNIKFIHKTIMEYKEKMDIVIALHACNTATDQAIFKGIKGDAKLIICSPCCHQQIYPQLNTDNIFKSIIKHGVYRDRTSEMITDSLRSLFLQLNGYKTKIIEFVENSHSGKNTLLIAVKHDGQINKNSILTQIKEIKDEFNITNFELEELLN